MTTPGKKRAMNVLLADDGSEHARAAVALLGDLPLPPKSLITALRVFTPIQSAEHIALQTALDRTQVLLQEKGMQAATELLLGYPSEKVVEYAEQHKPNLIVIGAKGLRATLGILLGGVAQQVVEYACCPVLVVRAPYAGLRRVLLVIDASECSQRAVKYVGHFPLPSNVEVQVMHVLPPIPQPIVFVEPTISGSEFIPPLRSPVEIEADTARQAEEEKQGQALLARAVKSLKATGLKANSVLRRGDAATEIIEYVKANQIDLIVAGSRGLSRIRGLLMGSVSRKLVHYSGCSVLIVKSPETRPRL